MAVAASAVGAQRHARPMHAPNTGETKTMANRNQQHNQDGTPRSGTSNRGFASMDAAQQREIARLGGEAVSGNREHMAQIGRKGGEASAESRANVRSAKARSAPESERASDRAHEQIGRSHD
jgi:general stress protein YciG